MRKAFRLIGIISIVAAIALSMAACDLVGGLIDDLTGGGKDEGGTFTLNGIPSDYNGKYAYFMGINENNYYEDRLVGLQSYSGLSSAGTQTLTLSRISNSSVSFPMWKVISDDKLERYSGNGTYRIVVAIIDSQTIRQQDDEPSLVAGWRSASTVAFSKGSAAMSWSQGEEIDVTDEGEGEGGEGGGGGGGLVGTWKTEEIGVGMDSAGNVDMAYYLLTFYSNARFQMKVIYNGEIPDYAGNDTVTGTYTISGNTGILYVDDVDDGPSLSLVIINTTTLRITAGNGEVMTFYKQ